MTFIICPTQRHRYPVLVVPGIKLDLARRMRFSFVKQSKLPRSDGEFTDHLSLNDAVWPVDTTVWI